MLIEFSVKNFLSFKERVTLSLLPSNAKEESETDGNILHSVQGSDIDLLRTATIYGANASGKTNLVKSMSFLKWFIENSDIRDQNKELPNVQFKLNDKCLEGPSEFEIVFLDEGIKHVYGFSINTEQVVGEWLFIYPKGQPRRVFERELDKETDTYRFRKGLAWKGEWKKIHGLTSKKALFLSVASKLNNEVARKVKSWFYNYFRFVKHNPVEGSELVYTADLISEKPEFRKWVNLFLNKADFGIQDFKTEEKTIKFIGNFTIEENDEEENISVHSLDDTEFDESGERVVVFIPIHYGKDREGKRKEIHFNLLKEESHGTQKLLALSGPFSYILETGSVLIADELDTQLHPLLTRWLIELFHNPQSNPKGAQLIFATHDDSLLDRKLFRRDQIWFTEKNREGSTELFSLWDIRTRNKEDIRKGYLMGRYGAVPYLDNPLE